MNSTEIITVISLVVASANGIGMILMYLRYIRIVRGSFAALRATREGDIEVVDLLSEGLHPFIR